MTTNNQAIHGTQLRYTVGLDTNLKERPPNAKPSTIKKSVSVSD